MLKTIKNHIKVLPILIKIKKKYSIKFENPSKCLDSTEYLQAKAKETLSRIKKSIIQQNLSENKDDLENLV